jgi:hypothetical protein
MVGEWGQAPILDKSESFVSVAVLKVFFGYGFICSIFAHRKIFVAFV